MKVTLKFFKLVPEHSHTLFKMINSFFKIPIEQSKETLVGIKLVEIMRI